MEGNDEIQILNSHERNNELTIKHESETVGILSTVLCKESDEDINTHGKILKNFLDQLYSSSQAHLIAVKQRLLEEKDIALIEAERIYLNKQDQYQNEINGLHKEIRNLEARKMHADSSHIKLCSKVINVMDRHHYKHSSSYSVSKIFRIWYDEVQNTRNYIKMDKVAQAFARKKLLTKMFYLMAYNFQKRKAIKQESESQFKFDSVTTEIIVSYESQLQRMRDDLKDAYASIEQEQIRRQQLEENLRTLFLKNMTNMNFEALSLFQHSHSMLDITNTTINAGSNNNHIFQKKNNKNSLSESTTTNTTEKSKVVQDKSNQQQHHHQYQYDNLIETPSLQCNTTPTIKSPPIIPLQPKESIVYDQNNTFLAYDNDKISPHNNNNNLLSELYKSNMSSTIRLAHNTTPLSQPSGRTNISINSSRSKNK